MYDRIRPCSYDAVVLGIHAADMSGPAADEPDRPRGCGAGYSARAGLVPTRGWTAPYPSTGGMRGMLSDETPGPLPPGGRVWEGRG